MKTRRPTIKAGTWLVYYEIISGNGSAFVYIDEDISATDFDQHMLDTIRSDGEEVTNGAVLIVNMVKVS